MDNKRNNSLREVIYIASCAHCSYIRCPFHICAWRFRTLLRSVSVGVRAAYWLMNDSKYFAGMLKNGNENIKS